jgi:Protein of unknown function (DUF4239)
LNLIRAGAPEPEATFRPASDRPSPGVRFLSGQRGSRAFNPPDPVDFTEGARASAKRVNLAERIPMALALLIGLVLASVLALAITDHVRKERKPERNDATALDYVNTFISTIYMVLLALVVVVQWQNIDQINADVRSEATTLTALVQTADRMPGSEGAEVRASAFDYAHAVLEHEWPAASLESSGDDAAQQALDAGQGAVTHQVALSTSLGTIEDQAIGEYQALAQSRADRLAVGDDTTSPALLIALGVLSLITVLTPLSLGLRADAIAMAGLAVSTLLVCLSFWFVLDLQTLYHGLIHVTAGPIQAFVASGGVS